MMREREVPCSLFLQQKPAASLNPLRPARSHALFSPFLPQGRHRWVIYNNLDWYTGQDAASISPEWHGWLHHITDANPASAPAAYAPPLYAIPKKGLTPVGVPRYAPKGAWTNPAQRSWVKVQAWKPPGAV